MTETVKAFPRNAKWIWPHHCAQPNAHVVFRRDFKLEKDSLLELRLAVETYAQVYLDGKLVHRYTSVSYPKQHYYDYVELEAVRSGEHQLAIVVFYVGVPSGSTWVKDPGLLCELNDRYSQQVISSNAEWKCSILNAWKGQTRRAPFLNLDFIEHLDCRDLPSGYPMLGLSACTDAVALNAYPGCRMPVVEQRSFPFLKTKESRAFTVMKAGLVTESGLDNPAHAITHERIAGNGATADGLELVNFTLPQVNSDQAYSVFIELDDYITGYPCVEIIAEAGAILDIAWHEYADNYQFDFIKSKLSAADRFVLVEGLNRIQPEEWKAMRYLQLTVRHLSSDCIIKDLYIEQSEYPLRESITIQCENKILQKILDISLNAVRLCMHGLIMDCPWREKRQWIGDVQRISLVNHHSFRDQKLVRAVLRQHAYLQENNGQMWPCQPLMEEYPSQSMEWVRAVIEYQLYSGDQSLLRELKTMIYRLAEWFEHGINAEGFYQPLAKQTIQWMENTFGKIRHFTKQGPAAFLNLRYLQFLEDMAWVTTQFQDHASAERFTAQAQALRKRIGAYFYDAESGLIRELRVAEAPILYSECSQALAISLQLTELPIKLNELWDNYIAKRNSDVTETIPASPFGKYHTHQALGRLNRTEELLDDIMAHWTPMVAAGSKTAWEVFASGSHESLSTHSQCHGWAGIPVIAVLRHLFRVDPLAAQDGKITLPQQGSIETKHGKISYFISENNS